MSRCINDYLKEMNKKKRKENTPIKEARHIKHKWQIGCLVLPSIYCPF